MKWTSRETVDVDGHYKSKEAIEIKWKKWNISTFYHKLLLIRLIYSLGVLCGFFPVTYRYFYNETSGLDDFIV